MQKLKLSSGAFENNGVIPAKYTCDGINVSPALHIAGVPDSARSLVLIMDDPDVPKSLRADGMWDHWVRYNIPPETTEIAEGEEPAGDAGVGTAGNTGYHGPCPPDREHRYFFKLYALDGMLDMPSGATKRDVERAMEGHIIEQTELVGRYLRVFSDR